MMRLLFSCYKEALEALPRWVLAALEPGAIGRLVGGPRISHT